MTIAWDDLETAFESCSHEQPSRWLDRQSGFTVGSEDEDVDIDADPDRYVRVEPPESWKEHEWMTEFTSSVRDHALRARLGDALRSRRPFRAFKDELARSASDRERWFELRRDRLREAILEWVDRKELMRDLDGPCPWTRAVDAVRARNDSLAADAGREAEPEPDEDRD